MRGVRGEWAGEGEVPPIKHLLGNYREATVTFGAACSSKRLLVCWLEAAEGVLIRPHSPTTGSVDVEVVQRANSQSVHVVCVCVHVGVWVGGVRLMLMLEIHRRSNS